MPPIEKQQFINNLDGYVGAVVIGPKGDDRGIAVEPGGTVWLSEAEQTLTANAPRSAADNPFVPQTWPRFNPDTGANEDVTVTPLTPMDEGRFVPASMRFVPGLEAEGARGLASAQQAATGDEPVVVTSFDAGAVAREQEVREQGPDAQPMRPPPVPPSAAAAAAAAAENARTVAESARRDQEAAQDAAQGSSEPAQPDPTPPPAPQAPPVVTPPPPPPPAPAEPKGRGKGKGKSAVADETAVEVDQAIGEETGAALPPQGDATAGTFTPGEEVGTPDAPQPPPFTPPER